MSAGLAPFAIDPFGPSANPGAYVACVASERARAALEATLDAGRIAAITGPPGHGKTLLLRMLGGREQERARVAYIPFPNLEAQDLFRVVLNEIGARPRGTSRDAPRDALLGAIRALAPRGGVVLLIDDAGTMSDDCAAALVELHRHGLGALRIALAAVEDAEARRVFAAFGDALDVVRLSEGMDEREVRRYVETRLTYGGARPELVAAFDEETIEALHRESRGVPRALNHLAERVVRRATDPAMPHLWEIAGLDPPAATRPEGRAASVPHLTVVPDPAPEPPMPELPVLPDSRPPVLAGPPHPAIPEAPPADLPTPAPEPPRYAAQPPPPEPEPPRPVAEESDDDARGILLPGVAVEHELPEERVAASADTRTPERRRVDLLRERAKEAKPPKKARELPIRAFGMLGFALGVAIALYWVSLPDTSRQALLARTPFGMADAVAPSPTELPGDAGPTTGVAPGPAEPVTPRVTRAPTPELAPTPAPFPAPPPATVPVPPIATLPPEPAPGAPMIRVSINATPWATIEVDGRSLGETPLAGIPLAPGVHEFRAVMPDGTTRERAVEIGPGNDTVVFQ